MTEVIRTTGDLRRSLAQAIVDVHTGEISVKQALEKAKTANKITASLKAKRLRPLTQVDRA